MSKKSKIVIDVELNDENMPVKMLWKSTDGPNGNKSTEAKAMMLSLFDKEYKDTYKIDLWTTEMQVGEMDRFVFQSIKSMADMYYKATGNGEMAGAMQQFAQYFGESTEIIPRSNEKS